MSIDRWTDKEGVCVCVYTHTEPHIYTLKYYSSIRKNETMPFATRWMDPEIIILSEVSQTEKDKFYMIFFICWVKKKLNNWLIYKTEIEPNTENKLMFTKEEKGSKCIN